MPNPSELERQRQELEDRPDQSDEFIISRAALDEADAAISGAIGALGDVANLSHALAQLRTAQGNLGDHYNGR